MQTIDTKFTKLLGIKTPIAAAPMYYATTPELVVAAIEAGAYGFIGAGFYTSQNLVDQLRFIRSELDIPAGTPIPTGVGFLGWILDSTETSADPRIPAVLDELPAAIWFAFGIDLGKYVAQVRAYDEKRSHKTIVFVIVNSVEEALVAANEWKVDVLVVQGIEAGGHGGAYAPPLLSLLSAVLKAIPNGPVIIAAGGISTGAQIAGFLTMGAAGVALGTRFLFTEECMYSETMKGVLVESGLNATIRGYVFDEVNRTNSWPAGIDGRAIANGVWNDFEKGLDLSERLKKYDEGKEKGERDRLVIWAGVGVGHVNEIKQAKDVVHELHDEVVKSLKKVASFLQ